MAGWLASWRGVGRSNSLGDTVTGYGRLRTGIPYDHLPLKDPAETIVPVQTSTWLRTLHGYTLRGRM